MKLKRKTIILSSLILCLTVIIAGFIIQSGLHKQKIITKALQDSVDLKIKGFAFTEVGATKTKWEVQAETATYDKKQNLAVLEVVQIKLTTSDGKVFVMNADQGVIATDKKFIEIKGHVTLVSDNGYRFYTDYLNYRDAEKKIFTDAPITMENRNIKVTGKGLRLHVDKGEMNIPSAVKATIS
ncbi:MAG TPA: LPS export ABC transporter periplasmic protein LptC [Smithella sp.]|nr:LPS export ABC transporter periplasmic protein LptC [Smithella sp.]MDM7986111.1 LPS export ABC transporter periplasmic protein LptC [Smithella sp.]HNY48992.1 LPS export ABC transporter periplasmic protein LptC [Smithella sp.]HOG89076.1 LPS export ABC transporter periplasmic protein LptC [Smithella sp.]HOU50988.1 LPS export ABC transporter periplasmic protein LptC [Smithella sp.]